MSLEFDRCPLCQNKNWILSNSVSLSPNHIILDSFRCGVCKNFTYSNISINKVKEKHSVEAEVAPYWIQISYSRSKTSIRNHLTYDEYLNLNTALQLNWINSDDVLDKIRMLMVFS